MLTSKILQLKKKRLYRDINYLIENADLIGDVLGSDNLTRR